MENIKCYNGIVTKDLLFIGTKSEGYYPVLNTEDGIKYRLHYKGDRTFNEITLDRFIGSRVRINGVSDKKRGHWRIVISSDEVEAVVQVIKQVTENSELVDEKHPDEKIEIN